LLGIFAASYFSGCVLMQRRIEVGVAICTPLEFQLFGLKEHERYYLRQDIPVMFLQINLSYDG
jgi:hypothetical protein